MDGCLLLHVWSVITYQWSMSDMSTSEYDSHENLLNWAVIVAISSIRIEISY